MLNKIKLKLKFIINIAVDGIFLCLWGLISWTIHNKFLPWLSMDGFSGYLLSFVAIAFEMGTAILCLCYIFIDLKSEVTEYKKKEGDKNND